MAGGWTQAGWLLPAVALFAPLAGPSAVPSCESEQLQLVPRLLGLAAERGDISERGDMSSALRGAAAGLPLHCTGCAAGAGEAGGCACVSSCQPLA